MRFGGERSHRKRERRAERQCRDDQNGETDHEADERKPAPRVAAAVGPSKRMRQCGQFDGHGDCRQDDDRLEQRVAHERRTGTETRSGTTADCGAGGHPAHERGDDRAGRRCAVSHVEREGAHPDQFVNQAGQARTTEGGEEQPATLHGRVTILQRRCASGRLIAVCRYGRYLSRGGSLFEEEWLCPAAWPCYKSPPQEGSCVRFATTLRTASPSIILAPRSLVAPGGGW